MRIAYLNTLGIPARYGGFETCVEEVGTRLVRKGYQVTVYCGCRGNSKYSSYKGVKLLNFPLTSNKFVDFPFRSLLSTFDALGRDYDIIHYFGIDSSICGLLTKLFSKRTVISLGQFSWNSSSYPRWVCATLRAFSWVPLFLPDATVVDSQIVRKWYLNTYGKEPLYIPYGAEVSPRGADPEVLLRLGVQKDKYVLFVGRLISEKGVHHLIRAFDGVGTRSGLQLVIVGGDPYGSSYELSLKSMANSNVKFLGYVYGADMVNLFKGAYIYASASELEGTSPALISHGLRKLCSGQRYSGEP